MERRWYRFFFCGEWWNVFATDADSARENFLLWWKTWDFSNHDWPEWVAQENEEDTV